ncbi:phospholipase A(2)-like [Monomorium pharaonis]|uniref:phospholipase A(2)-like n=1 Tax=Monomorium pharaonis TaxID=307658 RepID=UPI001746A774|nr:phospholipase A(2)-like [Monomorium pharaonis]
MSRVFVCLSVFFIPAIAIQFGDCENNTNQPECDANIKSGSDKTRVSDFEARLNELSVFLKNWNKIFGISNDDSQTKDDVKENVNKIFNMFEDFICLMSGTRRCDRNFARDENDFFKDAEACCRAHHNCQSNLLAGETEVNIINNGIFTRSGCVCDITFYMCLREARGPIARMIGIIYFSRLKLQCFHCIQPTEDCELGDPTECKGHCKKYQWIDSPIFT